MEQRPDPKGCIAGMNVPLEVLRTPLALVPIRVWVARLRNALRMRKTVETVQGCSKASATLIVCKTSGAMTTYLA